MIHFKEAFHGRSGYTLSLTNTADPRKYMYFPKFDWPRILNPKVTFPMEGANLAAVEEAERTALDQILAAVRRIRTTSPASSWSPSRARAATTTSGPSSCASCRELADEHDFLLIFDEVQTGFGATGKWWAHQHFDVKPDILAFGKKSQTCGIAASARLDEVDSVFKVPSRINSTWGSNLVDMVRGTRIIEVILEEKLLEHCLTPGRAPAEGSPGDPPGLPGAHLQPPGQGALLRPGPVLARNCAPTTVAKAQELGMIILSTGQQGLRFRPALNLRTEDLDLGVELLRKSLQLALEAKRPG